MPISKVLTQNKQIDPFLQLKQKIENEMHSQTSIVKMKQNKKQPSMRQSFDNPFKLIHTLMNFKSSTRLSFQPKTLKQFRQNLVSKNQLQKKEQKTTFLQPEQFLKSVLQQYTNTIKISQVKYYSSSKKGIRNYQTLQNQDIILIQRIANVHKLFAIFDGHGQYGKSIASACSAYFKTCLKSYQQQFKRQISDKQIVNIVKNCFKKTQLYLNNFKFNQIQLSGTTAIIVLVSTRNIFSFNMGNSRLVIAMTDQSGNKTYDFQVTHDHDLNRLDQRIRCKQKGAIISPLKDQLGQNYGPDRLWNKDQKRPGTYITRALGLACGNKAGIISEPQISVLSYNKRMKFLILASDGLWFVQQNDEVIEYLNRYYVQGELHNGLPALMQQACNRWKSKNQLMDDISIIVVTLSQQK